MLVRHPRHFPNTSYRKRQLVLLQTETNFLFGLLSSVLLVIMISKTHYISSPCLKKFKPPFLTIFQKSTSKYDMYLHLYCMNHAYISSLHFQVEESQCQCHFDWIILDKISGSISFGWTTSFCLETLAEELICIPNGAKEVMKFPGKFNPEQY